MKAIEWRGGQEYAVVIVPDPRPGPGQVLARIAVTAVCGSDLHLADFGIAPPVIPGHEASGTVVERGEGVHDLSPGDRVALDPVQPCGDCHACARGIEHLCESPRHLGWRDCPGTWAELVAIDAVNAHRLPDSVSLEAASLAEPAAVCRHSLERAGFGPGMSVLVIGDGPFGFLHAQWASLLGARAVIVAGHHDERLSRIAAASGAVVCNTNGEDLPQIVRARAGSAGVDVAIEATGSSDGPGLGIAQLRPRGTLVIFSYVWKPRVLDMGAIHMKELTLAGACRSRNAFGPSIAAIASGGLDTAKLIERTFPLEGLAEALALLRSGRDRVFKVALEPGSQRFMRAR
jgi:2-desacetyl-2-hydroxyethyl bacteriochlorophyllide A dehydrogenase